MSDKKEVQFKKESKFYEFNGKGCRTLESIETIEINQKLESTAKNFQRFRPLKRETISKISNYYYYYFKI